jgi:hypothetical protein
MIRANTELTVFCEEIDCILNRLLGNTVDDYSGPEAKSGRTLRGVSVRPGSSSLAASCGFEPLLG